MKKERFLLKKMCKTFKKSKKVIIQFVTLKKVWKFVIITNSYCLNIKKWIGDVPVKIKEALQTAWKGFTIGATMLVPGMSGGTMAMILGIYDKLIESVNDIFKKFKKSLIFLLIFSVPAIIGMILIATPLEKLMENQTFKVPAMFFFAGAIGGSIPLMLKKAQVKKFSWHILVYPVIGAALVYGISSLPSNLMQVDAGFLYYVMLVAAGFVIAIGLILPGISASSMILMFGMYDDMLSAVKNLNLAFLIPLGIGGLLGILLTTKLLDKAMKHFPKATYLIIFGFVLGAVIEVFPFADVTLSWWIVLYVILFVVGFFLVKKLTEYEDKYEENAPALGIKTELSKDEKAEKVLIEEKVDTPLEEEMKE